LVLGPDDIVLHGAQLPPKRGTAHHNFRPMSIAAKWSPISATAELLLVHNVSIKLSTLGCKITTVTTVTSTWHNSGSYFTTSTMSLSNKGANSVIEQYRTAV